jgi:ribosome biogenesis GTPase
VVSTGKNSAVVALDGEDTTRVAQLRRMRGHRFMPVPGDVALVRSLADGTVLLDRLEPRENTLTRRTVEGRAKTMAANVDTLVTVTALAQPPPRTVLLDQLVAFAELEDIAAALVFTKPDLAPPADAEGYRRLYASLGYPVAVVNPKTGEEMAALRALLAGRKSLMCGVSGVGKSSIFRSLGGTADVGELSRHRLGRQTTTAARLSRIQDGFLIDSPGVAEFGLGAVSPQELAGAFVEMREPASRCRFTDCTHLREPACGVRSAVERREISAERYASYCQILRAEPDRAIVR